MKKFLLVADFLAISLVFFVGSPTAHAAFVVGERIEATDAVNVRSGPFIPVAGGNILGIQPASTQGTVQGGPQVDSAFGITWYNVNWDPSSIGDVDGWSAANYLAPASGPPPPPPPPPGPPPPAACPVSTTGVIPGSGSLAVGSRIRVNASPGPNTPVRSGPFRPVAGTNVIGLEANGNLGSVLAGPVPDSGSGLIFWRVAYDDGLTGWSQQNHLQLLPDTSSPTAAIMSPPGGAVISGSFTIEASASDNVGVSGVQFCVDGFTVGAEDTAAPFQFSWDSTLVADGTHDLQAVARDAIGNRTASAEIAAIVANSVFSGGDGEVVVEVVNEALGPHSGGGWILLDYWSVIVGRSGMFSPVVSGPHDVIIAGSYAEPFFETATCTYPVGGAPCAVTLADFIPETCTVSGATACDSINVSGGVATKIVFRMTNSGLPTAGQVRIARTDGSGGFLQPGDTFGNLDGASDNSNPALFTGVSPQTHTANAIDVDASFDVYVGVCANAVGSTLCAPPGYTLASCTTKILRTCSESVSVTTGQLTNVEFVYVAAGSPPPGPPPPGPPGPPGTGQVIVEVVDPTFALMPSGMTTISPSPEPPSFTNPSSFLGLGPGTYIVSYVAGGVPYTAFEYGSCSYAISDPPCTVPSSDFVSANCTTPGVNACGDVTRLPGQATKMVIRFVTTSSSPPPPPAVPPPSPDLTGWSWSADNGGWPGMLGGVGWIQMGN